MGRPPAKAGASAANASTWIQPGIQTNLKLVEVTYGVSKNGNEFLAFYAQNEQGDRVSCTEWPVSPKKPLEQMTADELKKAQGAVDGQKEKIKQIVEVFFTKEELKAKPFAMTNVTTFKEMAEKVIAFLGDAYKNQLIRLKVVYDKKGWTTFGRSSRAVFIEPMTVTEEMSKIRILPSDIMIRPAQPDDEKKETNPESLIDAPTMLDAKVAGKEDDLPF